MEDRDRVGGLMRLAAIIVALLIGAIILVAVLTRPSAAEREQAAQGAATLRQKVLSREFLADTPGSIPGTSIRAVVFDWQLGNGTATLVAFDDGTTSLYFSSGGGVLGAGAHDAVKRAAAAFREEASKVQGRFTGVTEFPLPAGGTSVFYLVTDSATFTSGPIPSADLQRQEHPLGELARRAQDVITEVRKVS
jgi:hypothetical protein